MCKILVHLYTTIILKIRVVKFYNLKKKFIFVVDDLRNHRLLAFIRKSDKIVVLRLTLLCIKFALCVQVCSSCCDEMYCNITVPTNKTTAVYSSTRKANKSKQYPVLSNTRVRSSGSTVTSQSLYTLVPMLSFSFFL